MYQLSFYVPETHLETVKAALFIAGAGQFNGYDQCCWQVRGEGQFRPLAGSQPFLGETGQLEKVVEYRVEMFCSERVVKEAVLTLLHTHPYEQPAYSICKILTLEDFLPDVPR
jgi:hypothetical protein